MVATEGQVPLLALSVTEMLLLTRDGVETDENAVYDLVPGNAVSAFGRLTRFLFLMRPASIQAQ